MRGFLAIVLVLSFVPFIYSELGINNQIRASLEEMKNDFALHQAINEKTYDFERRFRNEIGDAKLWTVGARNDDVRVALICGQLKFTVGIFNSGTLQQVGTADCTNALRIENGDVIISGNTLLPPQVYAFYQNYSILNVNFTAMVPQETRI